MNWTHRAVKAATLTLTTGILVGAAAFGTNAAPTAGVTGLYSSKNAVASNTNTAAQSSVGTRSGVSVYFTGKSVTAKKSSDGTVTTALANASEKNIKAKDDISKIGIANVDQYVYIRSNPDTNSDYNGKLYKNAAAKVLGEQGDWYQVESGDVTGWINKQYLVVGDRNLINSASRKVATVVTTTLYVRKEATTNSGILTMVPGTDDLTIVDDSMKDSGWLKVDTEAGQGFVSTDFVTTSVEYTYAESKAAEQARLAKEKAEREQARKAALEAERKANAKKAASKRSSRSYAPAGSGTGSSVVSYAAQFVGNPYVYGASSLTNGTDCSGYVMSVYAAFGVSLPHSSSAMRGCGYAVSQDEMQPGDIVCYSGHVGIYAGNGTLVHASTPKDGIKYSNVHYRKILTVRRIF